jgi:hypothetical protein
MCFTAATSTARRNESSSQGSGRRRCARTAVIESAITRGHASARAWQANGWPPRRKIARRYLDLETAPRWPTRPSACRTPNDDAADATRTLLVQGTSVHPVVLASDRAQTVKDGVGSPPVRRATIVFPNLAE